jgi:hypothetical protein
VLVYVDDVNSSKNVLEAAFDGIQIKADITHLMRRYSDGIVHNHCLKGTFLLCFWNLLAVLHPGLNFYYMHTLRLPQRLRWRSYGAAYQYTGDMCSQHFMTA